MCNFLWYIYIMIFVCVNIFTNTTLSLQIDSTLVVSTDRWYIGDEWSGKWKRNHLGSVWRFYFGFVQKTIIYCFIYYFKINSLEIVSLEAKFVFFAYHKLRLLEQEILKLWKFKSKKLLPSPPAWKWFIQSWKAISWEIEDGTGW